ncbi:hypothetical protein GCM10020366_31730 [Saccharopolyspora gregorii]|uniref:Uncharacterized protein n=1 Tax=Saccharopolyspora gregorii TaxID=33914 RepID=A0ABP6RPI9_9PSEU
MIVVISAVALFVLVLAVVVGLLARRRPAPRGSGYTAAPFIGAGGAHPSTHSTSVHGRGFDGGDVSGDLDGEGRGDARNGDGGSGC